MCRDIRLDWRVIKLRGRGFPMDYFLGRRVTDVRAEWGKRVGFLPSRDRGWGCKLTRSAF